MSNVPSVTRPRTPEQRQAAIDRALARALEQVAAGILPTLHSRATSRDGLQTIERWTIASRSHDGLLYSITLIADFSGLRTDCTCAAGEADRLCWHGAAVRVAALGEIPHHDARRPLRPITREDIFGRAAC